MDGKSDALDNLAKLKNEVFEGDEEKLAVALGRPADEVRLWFTGGAIDKDAQEKINGIVQERLDEQDN